MRRTIQFDSVINCNSKYLSITKQIVHLREGTIEIIRNNQKSFEKEFNLNESVSESFKPARKTFSISFEENRLKINPINSGSTRDFNPN